MDEALRCLEDQSHFQDVLPSKEDPTFGPYLAFNRQYTYRLFSHALLGRLLFFKRFLQSMLENPSADDCRRRWLWAQLQPRKVAKPDENGICQDPLQEFMETALPWPVPNEFFDEAIHQTLEDIFSLWTPDTPFYIVLDEANVITRGTYCFLHAFEDNPILNEILSTWHYHTKGYNITFVVSGTDIPREYFEGEEWKKYRWCSDTGGYHSEDMQRNYISQFLPPSLRASSSGERFMERMWKWFRGRYVLCLLSLGCVLNVFLQA